MSIDIKQSTASPVSSDIGNKTIQGRVVSKTIKLAFFTTNANAVWGGNNHLRAASYPIATVQFPANRKVFRYQVGDPFLFSYAKYGISNMVLRVVRINEEALGSEKIVVTAQEDIYSIANAITEYSTPTDNTLPGTDYAVGPLTVEAVSEPGYQASEDIMTMPVAAKEAAIDLGFDVYISVDGGASYSWLQQVSNFVPYGTLSGTYTEDTYTIDTDAGFTVDFVRDADLVETTTWALALSGQKNVAILGDELIYFKTITPVSGTLYRIDDIIRGRGDTLRKAHVDGEPFWVIRQNVDIVTSDFFLVGADLKFKLVPFNSRETGDIADAAAIDLSIAGRARTPYTPADFRANGGGYAARYLTDIRVEWDARHRGKGAGHGIPGTILPQTDREGLFTVEVWVGGSKVRTASAIDALTWTYTAAMNTADNGSLASEVLFKLTDYRTYDGITYTSPETQVACKYGNKIQTATTTTTTTTTSTSTTTTTV